MSDPRWSFNIINGYTVHQLLEGAWSASITKICIHCEEKYNPWKFTVYNYENNKRFQGEEWDVSAAKSTVERIINDV